MNLQQTVDIAEGDLAEIFRTLSSTRMQTYIDATRSNTDAFVLYRLNQLLSELTFTLLSGFEVSLRNTMVEDIERQFQRSDWFRCRHFTKLLRPKGRFALREAKGRLLEEKRSVDSDRVCAALSFGFWTSLYAGEAANELWPTRLSLRWPPGIKLRKLRRELAAIQRLRNRVAHHEPIFASKYRVDTTNKLVTCFETINPSLSRAMIPSLEERRKILNAKIDEVLVP